MATQEKVTRMIMMRYIVSFVIQMVNKTQE